MAQGATRKTKFNSVTYKYMAISPQPSSAPDAPSGADNAAIVAAIAAEFAKATALEIKVRGDYEVLLEQAPDSANNITWRESGENSEQYTDDITPAPAQPPTFDIELSGRFETEVMQGLTTAAAGTYAYLFIDIQSAAGSAGSTAPGVTATSPQGTIIAQVIKHNKLAINVPTADVIFGALRGAQFLNASIGAYGPP